MVSILLTAFLKVLEGLYVLFKKYNEDIFSKGIDGLASP